MGRRFYADETIASWFLPTVVVVASLYPNSPCLPASERRLQQTAPGGSTVHDFQDVKQEVGYQDPKRYGEVDPTTLISWILIGSGTWCLLVIFLYAFFAKSSVDKIWLEERKDDADHCG
jgi:hypothetical protein